MTANEFLTRARNEISDDPNTRLTKLAKNNLGQQDCIIDIHAHIFDKKCLTVAYILLRMVGNKLLEVMGLELTEIELLTKSEKEIYDDIEQKKLNSEQEWKQLESEIEAVSEIMEASELFGFEIKEALKILKKKSMLEVLDWYIDTLSVVQLPDHVGKPFVSAILMMDLEMGWDIRPKTKFFKQIQELKAITERRPILPFLAVDPRRADIKDPKENLYELFFTAFVDTKAPFFGVKCYPALGYLPSDTRLDPIFQICEEKNIPVLSHCGSGLISTYKKTIDIRNDQGNVKFKIPGNSQVERADFLNEPGHWDAVINKYKTLKINIAHFGGNGSWNKWEETGTNERVAKIIDMMEQPNRRVFTDFSFNVVKKEIFNAFQKVMDKHPKVAEKTMFGTDYWVVLPAGNLLDMQKEFLEQMKDHQATLLRSAAMQYLFS